MQTLEFPNGKDDFITQRYERLKNNAETLVNIATGLIDNNKISSDDMRKVEDVTARIRQDVRILKRWLYATFEMNQSVYITDK